MIDTVPLPEKPVYFEIPVKLLQEFQKEPRIVIRHPWVIGIPVPEAFLKKFVQNPKAYQDLMKKFDIMLVPR
jgi:hypothetical protein